MTGDMTDTRPRPRRKRTSIIGVPQQPLPAATQRELKELVRGLATAHPDVRGRLLRWVWDTSPYAIVAIVADAILAALLRSQSPTRRAALADGLTDLGPDATTRVILALADAERPWQRVALADVLARLGPLVKGAGRIGLAASLDALADSAEDPESAAAIRRAVVAVRRD